MVILASIALTSAIRFSSREPDGDEYDSSVDRHAKESIWRRKKDFNIHIVKKKGRHGKVRQIHLFPVKQQYHDTSSRERDTSSESETHEHIRYKDSKEQEARAAESSKVEKMIDVDGDSGDNVASPSHHYEHKEKIKIKHHHHHHHHNHVKTVVKKEPFPVEKIVKVCWNIYSIYFYLN